MLTLPWAGRHASSRSPNGMHIDAGAAWVHGCSGGQPLVELADAAGVTLVPQCPTNPWMDPLRAFNGEVRVDGRRVPESEVRSSLAKHAGLLDDVARFEGSREAEFDGSLEEGLETARSARGGNGGGGGGDGSGMGGGGGGTCEVGEMLVMAGVEYWMGASLANLSLNEWTGDAEGGDGSDLDGNGWGDYPGHHALPQATDGAQGGMSRLVQWLYDSSHVSGEGCVRLGQHVTEICTGSANGGGVLVRTAAGTTIHAETVLVTIPLGVLKAGGVHFVPPLPDAKLGAIRRLAQGSYKKVWLEFETPFWEQSATFVTCALTSSKGEYDQFGNGFLLFDNLLHSAGLPVLEAVLVGRRADLVFGCSDEVIGVAVLHVLRRSYPTLDIPEPTHLAVTRWEEDPFSRGAYSFFPPGATERDIGALANPIGDRVFFGGEATDAKGQGSLHGAGASGVRAAADVRRALVARAAARPKGALERERGSGALPSRL